MLDSLCIIFWKKNWLQKLTAPFTVVMSSDWFFQSNQIVNFLIIKNYPKTIQFLFATTAQQ